MPSCVVKSCMNHDKNSDKAENNISFHRFPSDPVRNEAWSRVLRRERGEPYFKSNQNLRICSAHFKEDDFYMTGFKRKLKKSAIPNINVQALFVEAEHLTEKNNESDVTISKDDIIDVDISDMKYIFDTPREVALKRKVKKYKSLYLAKNKKIKNLHKQNARLKKKNESLINIIKQLKKKSLNSSEIEAASGVTPEMAENKERESKDPLENLSISFGVQ